MRPAAVDSSPYSTTAVLLGSALPHDLDPNHEAPREWDDAEIEVLLDRAPPASPERTSFIRQLLERHQIVVQVVPAPVENKTVTGPLIAAANEQAADEAEGVDDGDGHLAPPLSGWPFGQSHRLAAAPNDSVIIVEGGDAAEVVSELFPDDTVVLGMDKGSDPEDYDCQPLHGRDVYLWLLVGSPTLDALARRVTAAEAKSVNVINLTTLAGLLGQTPPEGWNPVDILFADGFDDQIIAAANNTETGLWTLWIANSAAASGSSVAVTIAPSLATWEPDERRIGQPHFENDRDIVAIACLFLATLFGSRATPLLRLVHDELYVWTGVAYRTVTNDYLRKWLYAFTCTATCERRTRSGETVTVPYNPNKYSVDNVVDALRALVHVDSERIPCWLDAKENPDRPSPKAVIPFPDGLLPVDHWRKNPSCALIPHTPQWFGTYCLPYRYQVDATCPQFLAFLESILPGDAEAIEALQMWIGYCLIADTSQHKALLIIGPPRGGKGVLLRIFAALLGEHNIAAPSLASLAQNFGIYPLIGKLAAIIADAHAPNHLLVLILDKLKGIIGEDSMTIDRKNRDPITLKLGVRFMLATNELSAFPDPSGALAARFIIIQLQNSFLGKEDRGLEPRLMAELPGILNWALAGLRKYLDLGKLIQPASGVASLQQLRHLTSPMIEFVEDLCEYPAPGKSIDKELLRDAFDCWARDRGAEKASATQFGIKLHAACPAIKDGTHGKRGEPRVKKYLNICLTEAGRDFVHQQKTQGGYFNQSDAKKMKDELDLTAKRLASTEDDLKNRTKELRTMQHMYLDEELLRRTALQSIAESGVDLPPDLLKLKAEIDTVPTATSAPVIDVDPTVKPPIALGFRSLQKAKATELADRIAALDPDTLRYLNEERDRRARKALLIKPETKVDDKELAEITAMLAAPLDEAALRKSASPDVTAVAPPTAEDHGPHV